MATNGCSLWPVLFFQDWEESDADVVRAMQAAMIASQATDSKSLLKTRAAAGSIDGRVGSNSPSPNSRCADASAWLQRAYRIHVEFAI